MRLESFSTLTGLEIREKDILCLFIYLFTTLTKSGVNLQVHQPVCELYMKGHQRTEVARTILLHSHSYQISEFHWYNKEHLSTMQQNVCQLCCYSCLLLSLLSITHRGSVMSLWLRKQERKHTNWVLCPIILATHTWMSLINVFTC